MTWPSGRCSAECAVGELVFAVPDGVSNAVRPDNAQLHVPSPATLTSRRRLSQARKALGSAPAR